MNAKGYNRRLEVLRDVLGSFGLEAKEVTPLEYDEGAPFPYNNYIYKVDLAVPATATTFPPQPCTQRPEGEVSALVFRLGNPHAIGLNSVNRVQNEVASMHLARAALPAALKPLIPAVHAWRAGVAAPADEAGFPWAVLAFLPGSPLDAQWAGLPRADRLAALAQMADVFAALQRAELPDGTTRVHGGLSIIGGAGEAGSEDGGRIVPGQMTTVAGGPWTSFADSWAARVDEELKQADKSSCLLGWVANDVRARIDSFVADGLAKFVAASGVDVQQFALVHGDLTMNNMLYDPEAKRLTAVLDFDFACITHPAVEFFSSFTDLGGATFKAESPAGKLFDEEIAKAWDDALAERGAIRPSDINGIDKLEQLRKFWSLLAPFRLSQEFLLARMSAERRDELRRDAEKDLIEQLVVLGY